MVRLQTYHLSTLVLVLAQMMAAPAAANAAPAPAPAPVDEVAAKVSQIEAMKPPEMDVSRIGDAAYRESFNDEQLKFQRSRGARIKELYGVVPGSQEFAAEQSYLQPPEHQTDVVHVIKGVIEAETGAIEHYNRIIEVTDGVDPVTQDMVIAILRDEEGHRRLFEGFLREFETDGLA